MQLKLKQSLFLLLFISVFTANAQKTARFNGKPYLIYPQTIDVGYSGMHFTISESSLEFYNYNMPPVIGTVEDGEYLMYSTSFDLKNKRKIGKEVVYDTIYHVFATLTIKNNKKDGIAKFYSRDNQTKPFAELPYQNDMLNGSIRLIQESYRYTPRRRHYDYYENDDYSYNDDYEYSPGGKMKYSAYVFELKFKDGVLDGLQKVKACYGKKDTLETKSISMEMGQKSGPYKKTTYYLKKKKPAVYQTTEGNYVKGEEEGEWKKAYIGLDKTYTLEYYTNGKQTARAYYSNGKLENKTLYGKDSVMKYASTFKSDKHIPIVRNEYSYSSEFGSSKADYVYFRFDDDAPMYYTYALGDSARFNYYKLTQSWRTIKDTIINGYYIQIITYTRWKGGSGETAYLIDSCSKKHNNSSYNYRRYDDYNSSNTYCKTELWDKTTDKKGKTTTVYTSTYDKLFTGDSLIPKSKYVYKKGAYTSEEFYQMALDYTYFNTKFTKGKYFNYQKYFVVTGGSKDGRVLRVIKIPTHYDTLTLTDTLMLKGKKFYEYDENYYNAFGDFSEDMFDYYQKGRRDNKANFNTNFLEFFTLEPTLHRSIYLGRKPFTGSLQVNVKYKKHPNKIKARVYEITQFFDFLAKKQIIELTVEMDKNILKKYNSTFIMPVRKMNFGIEEANFSGGASYYDIFWNQSISTYFSSNKIVSELEFELYRFNNHSKGDDYDDYGDYDYSYEPDFYRSRYNRKRTKIKLDNTYQIKSSSIQFEDGKKHGQWHILSNSTLEKQYNFSKGKKEGMQYSFSGYNYNYLNYVYNTRRDTVNGKVWNLDMNGTPNYSGYFNMGVPDGYFVRYNEVDTINRFIERYQFNKGYMVGTYELYRDSGQLKMTVDLEAKDSMYYDIYHTIPRMYWNYKKGKRVPSISSAANTIIESPDLSGNDFLTGIFSTTYVKKGNYKYYYKSGTIFSEGVKKDNNPVGLWSFYREGKDRIYKRIEFKDSIIEIDGLDTFHSYGIVKAYYDDGRLMFKGLALDQETKYSCESEADIPTEEDHYLEFYDTIGKPVLVNGSGFIEELQSNGYKLKEGRMVNGKKEGIWVYYSKFGLPNAIGAFENGKKSGRWLVGDLGGLNLSDKVCFMSNEEFVAWINTYGGNLNLKEEYYTEGKMMSGNMVDTIKR